MGKLIIIFVKFKIIHRVKVLAVVPYAYYRFITLEHDPDVDAVGGVLLVKAVCHNIVCHFFDTKSYHGAEL